MSAEKQEKLNKTAGIFAQWFGWAIGPIAWALHLVGSYLLVERVCVSGNVWELHALTVATAALAISGVFSSLRVWREMRRRMLVQDVVGVRSQFMSVGGMAISSLFFFIILVEGIPGFVLSACQ